ncbi:hypothetical protein [Bacteroides sp. An322]|uniref:hypothetical protein n=1 Tax=Bacteroides sp. An322 TaxID=1965632 RepID=UPI000B3A3809|nr:hypothetical protein [Bacteroides sp. An322]OUO20225.1 hypothetical protein B5F91_07390 [Bacteroides sp. An322]
MKSKNLNRVQMFILFGVVYLFVKCGYRPMKQWLIDGYVDWNAYSFGYTFGSAFCTLAVLGVAYAAIMWGYPWLKRMLGKASEDVKG